MTWASRRTRFSCRSSYFSLPPSTFFITACGKKGRKKKKSDMHLILSLSLSSSSPVQVERLCSVCPVPRKGRFGSRWCVQPCRGLLLGAWTPVAPQLYVQVQGDGGGGPEEAVSSWVSQRLTVRRSAAEVSGGRRQEQHAWIQICY